MKKVPIVDLLSLVIIIALGVDVYWMHDRIDRLELVARGQGDALDYASLLPLSGENASGQQTKVDRGAPKLIFYMSTHCGVCAHNMPVWSDIARQVGPQHVVFVLSSPAERPAMSAYLAKYGLGGFPAVTADPKVVDRFYMYTVPKTVLVNSRGKVEKVWRGVVTAQAVLPVWNSIGSR
ncbi:MAG TPA: hypothetical protein VGR95_04195 [Thermoanaerobaculia bacterium]|nr:hypothetical protein [Thermoanaerobaculia bacterium]